MDYQVKVENFEGPMDLLLFFIQRDKLNIYDIPIAHITKEFLDYIGINENKFWEIVDSFRINSPHIWKKMKGEWLLRHTVSHDGTDD